MPPEPRAVARNREPHHESGGGRVESLRLDPERVPRRGIELVEPQAARRGKALHVREAAFEPVVRTAQRRLRVDLEVTSPVDDGEQQVAEFRFDLPRIAAGDRRIEFAQFLVDLGSDGGRVGEVEPHACGTAAERTAAADFAPASAAKT